MSYGDAQIARQARENVETKAMEKLTKLRELHSPPDPASMQGEYGDCGCLVGAWSPGDDGLAWVDCPSAQILYSDDERRQWRARVAQRRARAREQEQAATEAARRQDALKVAREMGWTPPTDASGATVLPPATVGAEVQVSFTDGMDHAITPRGGDVFYEPGSENLSTSMYVPAGAAFTLFCNIPGTWEMA